MSLKIRTFGRLSIERDGETVAGLASSKAEALLVYLSCTGREHRREVLAELLWDDRTQRQAMANLRVVLSSLRKLLKPYVDITRTSAAVNPDAEWWLDVRQLQEAAEHAQGGIRSPAEARTLARALALYEGDFLAGFFLPEASGFESWAATERERLHRLALDALQRLGRWHLQHGEPATAVTWATRTVEVDPLAEEGHRQLMEALARNDQRAEALAQYETCWQIMHEELDVEPQEETRELYDAIRGDTLSPLQAEEVDSTSREVRHNLPAQPTPFFGRDAELAKLDEMLADPHARLVTITGVGGVGKTRLAYAAAERQLAKEEVQFVDGIYAVRLDSLDEAEQLPVAIAGAAGYSLEGPARDSRSAWRRLGELLQEKRVLFFLDNYEHLLPHTGWVSELLHEVATLQLLVTSRERLNLREERIFPLEGLEGGNWSSLEAVHSQPLGQLFLHSARRVRVDFELQSEELEHLARLGEITAGLPLAVELAASWVEVLPLSAIVAEIGHDLDFLRSGLRNLPRRQRSMRAVFEASWRRLEPALQTVFAGFSVFRGGFTRAAAKEVAGASLSQLAALSARSLLQYDAAQDRYRLHELLRQFGEDRLGDEPALRWETQQRHAAFYCQLLHEREQVWSGPDAGEALAELGLEVANVRRAWRWAVARQDVPLMAKSLHSLCTYYDRRGPEDQAQELLRTAIESLLSLQGEGADDIERRRLLVYLLAWLSRFSDSLEEREAVLQHGERLLTSLKQEAVDARSEEAFLAYWRGDLHWDSADVEPSRAAIERSLALYQELGDLAGTAWATWPLGGIEWHLGNLDEAAIWGRRALDQQKALGSRGGVADVLGLLGLIEKARGHLAEAQQAHRERYALFLELGQRSSLPDAAGTLAFTLAYSGEFEEAHTFVREGLLLNEEVRSSNMDSFLTRAGAFICIHLGRYDEARQHAERAVALARARVDGQALGWSLCFAGMLSLASGDYEEAVIRLGEAATQLTRVQKSTWMLPLTHQATAYRQLGRLPEARQALFDALFDSVSRRGYFGALHALPPTALYVADQGDRERAIELYALACRYPYVANSRWYEDVLGRDVAKWEKALPDDVVATARERGKALDLWQTAEELIAELEKGPD